MYVHIKAVTYVTFPK